jgi:hypothetical protein
VLGVSKAKSKAHFSIWSGWEQSHAVSTKKLLTPLITELYLLYLTTEQNLFSKIKGYKQKFGNL